MLWKHAGVCVLDSFLDEDHSSLPTYIKAGKEFGISETSNETIISNSDDVIFIPSIRTPNMYMSLHYAVRSSEIEARTSSITIHITALHYKEQASIWF